MSRSSGDEWKFSNGAVITVEPGFSVPGAELWNGFNYEKQYWVVNGVPQHHALCGSKTDRLGKQWDGYCQVCSTSPKQST